jgi:signal transduction histidine kinase
VAVSGAPASVLGDRAALERTLANLVENARRHGSGRITVETETRDGQALLTVSDEGPGLGPEEVGLAFERFWRGDQATAGSGLGLAIVRATAERHGGRVYVVGARFTIELPAVRDLSEPGVTTEGLEPEKGLP